MALSVAPSLRDGGLGVMRVWRQNLSKPLSFDCQRITAPKKATAYKKERCKRFAIVQFVDMKADEVKAPLTGNGSGIVASGGMTEKWFRNCNAANKHQSR